METEQQSAADSQQALIRYLSALEACYEWDRGEYQSNPVLVNEVEEAREAYYGEPPPVGPSHSAGTNT